MPAPARRPPPRPSSLHAFLPSVPKTTSDPSPNPAIQTPRYWWQNSGKCSRYQWRCPPPCLAATSSPWCLSTRSCGQFIHSLRVVMWQFITYRTSARRVGVVCPLSGVERAIARRCELSEWHSEALLFDNVLSPPHKLAAG